MSKTLKLTNALACLSQYLSPDTFSFVESQVKMSKRSRHAYRWKTEDKMLALSSSTAGKHTKFYPSC